MKRIIIENTISNISQSNKSDIAIPSSPNRQEKKSEIKKNKSKNGNETPLCYKGNVKSYCRIRPNNSIYSSLNKFRIENKNKLVVDFSEIDRDNPSKQYNFTEIFWTTTTNQEIYEKICKENIKQLFTKHKNSLIFVYGITNSGKTYTVNGVLNSPGILQLSLKDLFKEFHILKENNNLLQLTCTYIEIYNEEIFDLLSKERKKLEIGGSTSNRFYPKGAIIKNIENFNDFENALKIGEFNRSKGETKSNPYSSRSHSLFRVELSYKGNPYLNKDYFKPVSLCIVDLAGAERVSNSGVNITATKEAGNINKSLFELKNCFKAMVANSKTNFLEKKKIVPVRNSKLTSLFVEYFAPHQNISIICTINPDINIMKGIKFVLKFGSKAMRVKTIKSWIKTNYNLRDISSTNLNKNSKRYRMYTNEKYLNKNCKSKEKNNKFKEDSNSEDSSLGVKNKENSSDNILNIKLLKDKTKDQIITQKILAFNIMPIKLAKDKNSNNNNDLSLNYEDRKKCNTNPFQLLSTSNFFVKYSAIKENQILEHKFNENNQKDNLSKTEDDIKYTFSNFLKKVYNEKISQNIETYENQCKNIDLFEMEMLLSKKNNIYSFKNPFIKNNEEDTKIFNHNLKICSNNNIGFISDITLSRNNNNKIVDDLINLRIPNSNDHKHEKTKKNENFDKNLEKYQPTDFKPYLGITESLINKKEEENKKTKDKQILKCDYKSLNNDIKIGEKSNNNIFVIFNNEINFKKKGKTNIYSKIQDLNIVIGEKDKIKTLKTQNVYNTDDKNEIKSDIEKRNNNNNKSPKTKKGKKTQKENKEKEPKENIINNDEQYSNSNDIEEERVENKNKYKLYLNSEKNKKKKIESDNETYDNSFSDENINIKPPRLKKGRLKTINIINSKYFFN